jgi:N-acetylglucosaminyldiphosphoundecaprenol N-acetyl-beta-D-mannosaminyltransferase
MGSVLGIDIGDRALGELVQEAVGAVAEGRKLVFACANPHSLVVARKDCDFATALIDADHVVADGVGITMVAKWLKRNVGPRITGHEYFIAVMQALNNVGGVRVFFLGSTDTVLDRICERAAREFPRLNICGRFSPPFGAWNVEDEEKVISLINAAQADVIWVGMTAPKQEKWCQRNKNRVDAALLGSIGAVFDFYAGTYPRAPEWMCRMGLEWLGRLLREPRRMWRRNFISSPLFVLLAMAERIRGR